MKIRTRLFITFLVIVCVGFYKLVDWICQDLRPRYLETMEESMNDTAAILASLVEQQVVTGHIKTDGLRSAFDSALRRNLSAKIYDVAKLHLNVRVYITDRTGLVLFDSEGGKDEGKNYSRWNDVSLTLKGQYGARTTHADPADPRTAVLYVAAPIRIDGHIAGVLTVGKPAASLTLFWDSARRKILLAGAVAALSVALLGMVISAWITWPIRKLTDYANAVRDGRRISAPALGSSEIGELGAAFEKMKDSLEGKQYVENYVQTLTHEMKSPLSAIRGAAELLNEDMPPEQRTRFLTNIRAESARIQDLIDRLLQLSSVETRKGLQNVESVEIPAVLAELVEGMSPLLKTKDIRMVSEGGESLVISGERFLIRQSLSNLIQNAIDFSPIHGRISVAVAKTGTGVRISISDQGPGIPDYALSKVFDRFFSLPRPDTGKKSSGLGLTFTREAAILHGGNVALDNIAGGGVMATLTLPFTPA